MGTQWDGGGWTGTVGWAGLEGMEPRVLLSAGPVTHFQWDTISSPQTVGVPFTATITAKDAGDNTVTDFTGPVNLSGLSSPGIVEVGAGTNPWSYPLYSGYEDARTQVIYQAGELGCSGPITSLALDVMTIPGQLLNSWTIRMKHTTLSAYSTYAWESTGWTTVYQSSQTISGTGWTTFVFSTPFDYDGTSNLMVDFSFNNSSYSSSGSVRTTGTSQIRSLAYYTNSVFGDPLTWSGASWPTPCMFTVIPNIRLSAGRPVAISPTTSGSFVNGIWTGQVAVGQGATGMYLKASDAGSPVGNSNTFDVAYVGNLGVTVPTSATEGNGVLAGQGTVTISQAPATDLTVTLASSDTTEVTVPATVTILAGQTSATFDLTVINDTYLDGSQGAVVSAMVTNYRTGSGTITIHDNETATLTVTLPDSATEGAGTLTGAGTVKVSATPTSNVTVNLSSNDTSELAVPAMVTILAGQTSAKFDVTIVNDTVIDGTKTVAVTAHVENWTNGTASMTVRDNEERSLGVGLPYECYENEGIRVGAGRVYIWGPLEPAADLVVTLASSDLTELTVPATVTIPAGQASAAFDLTFVDDAAYDGMQKVTVTASAAGFTSRGTLMLVGDNEVHHFAVGGIASPQTAGVPFSVTVWAQDVNSSTITVFTGTAGLSGSGDGGAVSVTPTTTPAFTGGAWTGAVAINRVDTNVVLTASDGAGHTGVSNAFSLLIPSGIHGAAWTDLDGDGLREAGEPALRGWTVYLDTNRNGQWDTSEPSQATDADGQYAFPYLRAGSYAVREVVPSGWTQTCPGGAETVSVTLALGQVVNGIDFGDFLTSPSEIHGTKWNDLDGDGVRDVGEPPLSGWTVYLDTNLNGQWDGGESSQVTDANGQYAFTYLPAGPYSVGEVMPSGWRQTWPSGAGTTSLLVNGGFETGTLAGWTSQNAGDLNVINNGSYDPASTDGALPPYEGGFSALTEAIGVSSLEFHSAEGWSVPVALGSCVRMARGPSPSWGNWGTIPPGATDYGFEDVGGPNGTYHGDADYDDIVLRVYDNDLSVGYVIWATADFNNSIWSNSHLLLQVPPNHGGFTPPLTVPIQPRGATVLYQDVAVPAGATATLSWVDMIRNHADAFQDPGQEYRAEIRNTADQVLATVFSTNPGDPLLQDWTARSVDLSPFAGQTVRIAFVEQHSAGAMNVHIDDVTLTGTGGNWPISVTLAAGQVVTGMDFGNRCMVTVKLKYTNDATPSLTGTVDDPAAAIAVTVDGHTYAGVNNGDGTWTLADDVISPALGRGRYDVHVTATDAAGNAGMDATTNELIVYRLMGDSNLDGQVGTEDFGLMKEYFGLRSGVGWGQGDLNGDGQVGPEDFGLLKEHFGEREDLLPPPLMAAGPMGAGVFTETPGAGQDDKLDILDTLAALTPMLDLAVL